MSTPRSNDVQVGAHPAPTRHRITVTAGGPYKVEGQPRTAQQIIEPDKGGHSSSYTASRESPRRSG